MCKININVLLKSEDDQKKLKQNKNLIIIMNHRTRLDWLFFFCVLRRLKGLDNIKIILKRDLRGIPGPGWAMQFAFYIFLNRKWETDCVEITNFIDYYKQIGKTVWLLLFPEGTNLTAQTRQKSADFAALNHLSTYENLLVPRNKGFMHLFNQMNVDSILDVTIWYDKPIESELEFLKGNFPTKINFYLDTVNSNLEKVDEEWLYKRWQLKDSMLKS